MKIDYYHVPGRQRYALLFAADVHATNPRQWVRVSELYAALNENDDDDVWEIESAHILEFLKSDEYHTTYRDNGGSMKILTWEMYQTILTNQDTRNGVTNDAIEELRAGMLKTITDPEKIASVTNMSPMKILETLLGEKMDAVQVQSVLNQPDGHAVGFSDFEKITRAHEKLIRRLIKRAHKQV